MLIIINFILHRCEVYYKMKNAFIRILSGVRFTLWGTDKRDSNAQSLWILSTKLYFFSSKEIPPAHEKIKDSKSYDFIPLSYSNYLIIN